MNSTTLKENIPKEENNLEGYIFPMNNDLQSNNKIDWNKSTLEPFNIVLIKSNEPTKK